MHLRRAVLAAGLVLLALASLAPAGEPAPGPGLRPVPFTSVAIDDVFWNPRLTANRKVTLEANLHQCEITGRLRNFAVAGKLQPGKHEGLLFNDSDVYKVIEGIGYALARQRDSDVEKRTDALIDAIVAAQRPDGYLNTYYTLVEPQNRWKNIAHGHELYCAGHLIEAAVAYHQATGKRKLLDCALRFADHICDTFGYKKRIDTSGHEEIELALIKLALATGDKKYLDQAKFFIDVRGRADLRKPHGEYAQDHKPVREQTEVAGHAVRAMYLYCGMADLAALTGDRTLIPPLEKIWTELTSRRMYLTGGIGPSAHNEGFTVAYDLPNDTAYAETCASIGLALWNHRMFLMTGDARYADVLEQVVYNGLLSGVSLKGDRFFYTNPLGGTGNHHRVPWFACACCPPNMLRYVAGIGERAYATRGNDLWTCLYLGGTATAQLDGAKVSLTQETRYPWDGAVRLKVNPEKAFDFALHLRVPAWCKGQPRVTVNNQLVEGLTREKGYLRLARTWKAGDVVALDLPMPVERVHADPRVKANVGRVALQRGPVVFCLEGADNGDKTRRIVLPRTGKLKASFDKDLLGGVVVLRGEGQAVVPHDDDTTTLEPATFTAIPYSTWDNRAAGPMVVWLPETPEGADLGGNRGILAHGVRVRASQVWNLDHLEAVNDGKLPKSSGDHDIPRMTWWDHKGTTEWVSYRFPAARKLSSAEVYWFDDTGRGGCRVPASWRLLVMEGQDWKPVTLTGDARYGVAKDGMNRVTFEPVTAREMKLEVKLQDGFSGGVLEWRVKGE